MIHVAGFLTLTKNPLPATSITIAIQKKKAFLLVMNKPIEPHF